MTGFLDLPAELRTTIYNLVLTTYRINIGLGLEKNKIKTRKQVHGHSLQLRSLCKQVRQETQHIVNDAQLFLHTFLHLSSSGVDLHASRLHLRALPLPDTVMKHVERLTVPERIVSRGNLLSLLRLLPHLKRIEVDLGTQTRRRQEVADYLMDRLGIDGELAGIAAGTDLRCEASWRSPSGRNIFDRADEFRTRVGKVIYDLEEDVMVMAKQSILVYTRYHCAQPCDCPTNSSQQTVMDLVRTFLQTTRQC